MSPGNDDDTVEISPPRYASDDRPPAFSALVEVDVAGLSHPGCVRPSNRDGEYGVPARRNALLRRQG